MASRRHSYDEVVALGYGEPRRFGLTNVVLEPFEQRLQVYLRRPTSASSSPPRIVRG